MKTYNEIREAILSIKETVQPVKTRMFDMVHSDGLTQTHQEYIFGEPVVSIRKAIWNSNLTLKEKQKLNEALVAKLRT